MKIKKKIMASAIAFAVGLSAASAATTTNSWWSVDFESYTKDAVVAGVGNWSHSGANDVSKVIDIDDGVPATQGNAINYIVKLDTQGDSLTWTPATQTGNRVLVDTDVYLVGSDEAPAASVGTVQTEVYLSTAGTTTNLCAHVGNGSGTDSVWKTLTGVTMTDKSWIRLRIEIDYDAAPRPMVSFFVNGYKMSNGTDYSWDVMYAGQAATKVTSVSFMGTGYLDNFVGKTVEITEDEATFSDGGVNTNGVAGIGSGTIDTGTPGVVGATFAATLGSDPIRYVQISGPNGYVRTARTSNGVVSFSTVGLAAGTYSITGYYGNAPTLTTGLAAPAAATVGAHKAASVAAGQLTLTVAPRSGLYYTAFVGANGGTSGLTAGAASVVATPADEDAGFLQISLPAPTEANGVNLIKIYASDEAYDTDEDAPANE